MLLSKRREWLRICTYERILIIISLNSYTGMIKPSMVQKSKRIQLVEKIARKQDSTEKANKGSSVEPIDLDSDLDDNQETIKRLQGQLVELEKQLEYRQPVSKLQDTPKKQLFNKFNYARLEKINASIDLQSSPVVFRKPQVGVVMDEGKIDDKELDAYKAYIFQVEGSKQQYNVRKVILKDKAFIAPPKQITRETSKNDSSAKQTKEQGSDDRDDDLCERKNRYFQISHEVCYKCNKEGHYAKNCIEEEARKCKTCFARDHDQRNCPQICFECGGVGHISSECPQARQKRCERCQKRGHTTECCGVIVNDKMNLSISRLEEYFMDSDLKKMKCIIDENHNHQNRQFHFNCFEYKDWPMPYHELRKGNKNEQIRSSIIDDHTKSRRFSVEQLYRANFQKERVYDHYRDRFQRQYGRNGYEDRRGQGQNRSFSHNRPERGHHPQRNDRSQNRHGRQNNHRNKRY